MLPRLVFSKSTGTQGKPISKTEGGPITQINDSARLSSSFTPLSPVCATLAACCSVCCAESSRPVKTKAKVRPQNIYTVKLQ